MSNPTFTIATITRIPYGADEEPGMPTFRIEGAWKGVPSVYDVACELDGREADWQHVSGADPSGDNDDDFMEAEQAVYEAIWETEAFKQAEEEYNG